MQLTIEKLIYGGDGLARLPADDRGRGKAVFVPFVLGGEVVEVSLVEQKAGFARGRVENVLQASAQRVEARCPYFGRCGGCHYQHTDYEHQLEIKGAILKENLRRLAKLELETELVVHPSPAWGYRNRSRLKIQTAPEFVAGYYKFGSHELLAVEECPISSPLINRGIAALWALGRVGKIAAGIQEIEFFVNGDDTHLLVEVYGAAGTSVESAGAWAQELKAGLDAVGVVVFAAGRGSVEAQRIAAAGAGEIAYQTKHACFRVSAGAFFQVNRHRADDLMSLVFWRDSGRGTQRTVGGDGGATGTALDLYAGGGLFSSVLNREFDRVIAVESSQTSYGDLLYNSAANVKAVRSTTEQYLQNVAGKLKPDFVVVDPPRSGLGESVVRGLVTLGAPRLTYVSCDPATLSRDLGGLLKSGYRVEQAHLVDLFPQTYHLESVFHLVR